MIQFVKVDNEYHVLTSNTKKNLGSIYCEIDGFYVFWPDKDLNGFYDEYFLETILNKLKELNHDWKIQIDDYFDKEVLKDI